MIKSQVSLQQAGKNLLVRTMPIAKCPEHAGPGRWQIRRVLHTAQLTTWQPAVWQRRGKAVSAQRERSAMTKRWGRGGRECGRARALWGRVTTVPTYRELYSAN